MELSGKFSAKIRAAIKAKLTELGAYVDDELPDYIMVMVANRKGKDHMAKDLALFLGQNTSLFIDWLHAALTRLEAGGDADAPGAVGNGGKEDARPVAAAAPLPDAAGATTAVSAVGEKSAPAPAPPPPPPVPAAALAAAPALPVAAPPAAAPAATTNNSDSIDDAGRRRRPRSPTSPDRRVGGGGDRRRSPPAAASASALKRQSSSSSRREEHERLRSGRRGGGGGRRSRTRSRSRSRNRHAGAETAAPSSRNRTDGPLRTKNMLMKAMSEAERSVKTLKRDPEATPLTVATAAVAAPAVEDKKSPTAEAAASGGRANGGGLSERIRDRLGERPRSRSPSRSRSAPRSPRDRERRRHHRRQRRHRRGSRSRSRSRSAGRRRSSHSRQRRSSRGGGSSATKLADKKAEEHRKTSPTGETKRVLLGSDLAAAAAATAATTAPVPVAIGAAALAPVAVSAAASAVVNAAVTAAPPPSAATAAEPQFVVTLTGAGDHYRQLSDRLGGRQRIDDMDEDVEPADYTGVDLEQLAEEIIEFEEFEEELPLPHSYNLFIGDSDTEEEQSPAKRAAAAAAATAAAAAAAAVKRPLAESAAAGGQLPAPANQGKQRERCRYWPACKSGQACPYWHPVEPCKAFPSCKFGNTCLFVHPPCRYQAMCANPVCPFTHKVAAAGGAAGAAGGAAQLPAMAPSGMTPTGVPAGRPAPGLTTKCRFFPNCTNMSCPFYHPTVMCRYGLACTNQQACLFNHPSLPSRSKLVWTKQASFQGLQQAEAVDTAGDDSAAAKATQPTTSHIDPKAAQSVETKQIGASNSSVREGGGGGVIKLR